MIGLSACGGGLFRSVVEVPVGVALEVAATHLGWLSNEPLYLPGSLLALRCGRFNPTRPGWIHYCRNG